MDTVGLPALSTNILFGSLSQKRLIPQQFQSLCRFCHRHIPHIRYHQGRNRHILRQHPQPHKTLPYFRELIPQRIQTQIKAGFQLQHPLATAAG